MHWHIDKLLHRLISSVAKVYGLRTRDYYEWEFLFMKTRESQHVLCEIVFYVRVYDSADYLHLMN